jgi:hypothetical protein
MRIRKPTKKFFDKKRIFADLIFFLFCHSAGANPTYDHELQRRRCNILQCSQ